MLALSMEAYSLNFDGLATPHAHISHTTLMLHCRKWLDLWIWKVLHTASYGLMTVNACCNACRVGKMKTE